MDDQQNTHVLNVEVAYALPFNQKVLPVKVPEGTSVYEVVERSDIVRYFPEIDLASVKLGLFGKAVLKPREQKVKEGDRVEIYRPLIADPKEVRKKRAEQARLKAATAQKDKTA